MKRIIFLCAAVLVLGACNDMESSEHISDKTRGSFQDMYPGAKGVEWEKRGIYKVAVFSYNGEKLSAWYNQDADWCMTEKQMDYHSAPAQVINSYKLDTPNPNNANYVDKLTRDGIEDIYVVVEGSGNSTTEYYYSGDGVRVKIIDADNRIYEDYRNEIVPQVPGVVYSTVSELYKGARIMEVDVIFPGILYVDIVHNSTLKTLEFSLTGAWSMSRWTVTESYVKSRCPEVYSAYTALGYNNACELKSIDFYENSSVAYYWFILDNNGTETNIKISDHGEVITVS